MRSVVPEQPQVIEAVEKLCRQDDFGAQRGKPLFQIRPGGAPVVANQLQRLSNHNRGRDKALLRVASDSLFEGVPSRSDWGTFAARVFHLFEWPRRTEGLVQSSHWPDTPGSAYALRA